MRWESLWRNIYNCPKLDCVLWDFVNSNSLRFFSVLANRHTHTHTHKMRRWEKRVGKKMYNDRIWAVIYTHLSARSNKKRKKEDIWNGKKNCIKMWVCVYGWKWTRIDHITVCCMRHCRRMENRHKTIDQMKSFESKTNKTNERCDFKQKWHLIFWNAFSEKNPTNNWAISKCIAKKSQHISFRRFDIFF